MDGYALRVERHTEFITISFIEQGRPSKAGLDSAAFDPSALPHLPFDWISQMPCEVFHAIWLEIGGKPEFSFLNKMHETFFRAELRLET